MREIRFGPPLTTKKLTAQPKHILRAGLMGLALLSNHIPSATLRADTFQVTSPNNISPVKVISENKVIDEVEGLLVKIHIDSILKTPVEFWALKSMKQGKEEIIRLDVTPEQIEEIKKIGKGAVIRAKGRVVSNSGELIPWSTLQEVQQFEVLQESPQNFTAKIRKLKLSDDLETEIWVIQHNKNKKLYRLVQEGKVLDNLLKRYGEGASVFVTGRVIPSTQGASVPWSRFDIENLKDISHSGIRFIDESFRNFVREGDKARVLHCLSSEEVDINSQDSQGNTAILLAADYGHIDIVKTLIQEKADLDIQNNEGKTALSTAIVFHDHIVEALINGGANPNIQDEDGVTSLMEAAHYGNTKLIKVLINAGADPNIQDRSGSTALMWAAFFRNTDSLKALINTKTDPNVQDRSGATALMKAAYFGDAEMIKALIDAKADLNVIDKYGMTALNYAEKAGNTQTINALLLAQPKQKQE